MKIRVIFRAVLLMLLFTVFFTSSSVAGTAVKVMTYNVDEGTDFGPIVDVLINGGEQGQTGGCQQERQRTNQQRCIRVDGGEDNETPQNRKIPELSCQAAPACRSIMPQFRGEMRYAELPNIRGKNRGNGSTSNSYSTVLTG